MSSTPLMPDDRRSLTLRLTFVQYLVAVAFAALAIGFWIFQIAQHEKFREMAENNYMQRLPLPAPRGVIRDRNGKILVTNAASTAVCTADSYAGSGAVGGGGSFDLIRGSGCSPHEIIGEPVGITHSERRLRTIREAGTMRAKRTGAEKWRV